MNIPDLILRLRTELDGRYKRQIVIQAVGIDDRSEEVRAIKAHAAIIAEAERGLGDDPSDESALWLLQTIASIYFPEVVREVVR